MLVELIASEGVQAYTKPSVKIAKNIFFNEDNIALLGVVLEDKFCFYAYLKTLNSWDNFVVYQHRNIDDGVLLVEHEFLSQRDIKEGEFARLEPMPHITVF